LSVSKSITRYFNDILRGDSLLQSEVLYVYSFENPSLLHGKKGRDAATAASLPFFNIRTAYPAAGHAASIMFPFCLPVSQRTSASFSSSGTFASHPRDMM